MTEVQIIQPKDQYASESAYIAALKGRFRYLLQKNLVRLDYGLCFSDFEELQCLFYQLSLVETQFVSIYYWQFDNLTDDIQIADTIDLAFLSDKNTVIENTFRAGFAFPLTGVGRLGIALVDVEEDAYILEDLLGLDVTSDVFDSYYNSTLRMQIYITKEYYAPGELTFKLKS